MFSNFRDTFIKKPQFTSAPPQVVIDLISQDLPEGFHYIHVHDGLCRIDASEGLNFQSGKVALSDEGKTILPKDCKMGDILRYSYNAQEKIALLPNDDGCFVINGKNVPAADFVKTPMQDKVLTDIQIDVIPPEFPEPFYLEISGAGYTEKLQVRRVPNRSLTVAKYESDKSTVLTVWFTIDQTQPASFTFNITVNMKNVKSVKEAISAFHIYNAFSDKNGYVNGQLLYTEKNAPFEKVPTEVVRLAEKLSKLEECLNVQFDFSKGLTDVDARTIDELYRSFIEMKPFKIVKTFDSLSGKGHFIDDYKQREFINTAMVFEYSGKKQISLLGVDLDLCVENCIFNAIISSFSATGDKETGDFVIHLSTAPGEKMYESVRYFISEKQLTAFQNDKNHIAVLHEATEIETLE